MLVVVLWLQSEGRLPVWLIQRQCWFKLFIWFWLPAMTAVMLLVIAVDVVERVTLKKPVIRQWRSQRLFLVEFYTSHEGKHRTSFCSCMSISNFGCGLIFLSFAVPELDELAPSSLLMPCWRALRKRKLSMCATMFNSCAATASRWSKRRSVSSLLLSCYSVLKPRQTNRSDKAMQVHQAFRLILRATRLVLLYEDEV